MYRLRKQGHAGHACWRSTGRQTSVNDAQANRPDRERPEGHLARRAAGRQQSIPEGEGALIGYPKRPGTMRETFMDTLAKTAMKTVKFESLRAHHHHRPGCPLSPPGISLPTAEALACVVDIIFQNHRLKRDSLIHLFELIYKMYRRTSSRR